MYPEVQITNSVANVRMIDGTVSYMSCNGDSHVLTKTRTMWQGPYRGICLVTKITATITTLVGDEVAATLYTSSGTSYSQYAVISRNGQYQVTRVVS